MPGIAGFFGKKVDCAKEKISQMLDKMSYGALYHQESLSYGDYYTGSAYLHDGVGVEENDSVVLSFYGEVFDIIDHDIHVEAPISSANEVLNYIMKFGFDIVKNFNGAFAMAYYEKSSRRIRLVTDRMSMHRLYIWEKDGMIAFSSESKAFYCLDDFKAIPDYTGIGEFLTSRFCFGRRTFWEDVKMCSPGSIVTIDGEGISEEIYWNANYDSIKKLDKNECVEKLYETIGDAVRKRCPDDEIAMGLSGGCDARTVLNFLPVAGKRIHSFTYGPSKSGDVICAKKLSDAFDTDGHYVDFSDEDLLKYAKEVVWRTDGIAEADLFFHIKMTEFKRSEAKYEVSSVPGDAVSGKINAQTSVMLRGNRNYSSKSSKTKLFRRFYELGLKGKPDFYKNSVFSQKFTDEFREKVEKDYIDVSTQRCTSDTTMGLVLQNQLLMTTTGRSIPVMGGVPASELIVRFPFLDYHVLDTFGKMPYSMWKEQRAYLSMIGEKCPKAGKIPHYVTGTPISPRMNRRFIYLKIKDYLLRKIRIQQKNNFLSDTYDFKRDIIAKDAKGYVKEMILKPHIINDKIFDSLTSEELNRLFVSARNGNEKDYQKISTRFNAAVLSEVFFDGT